MSKTVWISGARPLANALRGAKVLRMFGIDNASVCCVPQGELGARLKRQGARHERIFLVGLSIEAVDVASDVMSRIEVISDANREGAGFPASSEQVWGNPYLMSGPLMAKIIDAAIWFSQVYGRDDVYERAVKAIARNLDRATLEREFARELDHYGHSKHRRIIGEAPVMCELRERIARIAKYPNARVMILGETGTGKETVAMQIHYRSERRSKKFVAFNCATVTVDLLESRLFGYEPKSFTGAASTTKKGLFEEADGGTLFLDEIGELRPEVQGILLRALEEGRIMRVGGNEEIPVDVRLICATNRNLPEMVKAQKFRADLYQRLCVAQIRIPPLREHIEDIPAIVSFWQSMRQGGGRARRMNEKDLRILQDYDYPGNVRELLNLLERAEMLDETNYERLLREHREMNGALAEDIKPRTSGTGGVLSPNGILLPLDEVMRQYVSAAFVRCGSSVAETARALGVSRNTVRKHKAGVAGKEG